MGSDRLENPLNSYDLLWLGLLLLVLLGLAFLLPVTPNDYWWYVRIGRDTLLDGAIQRVDTLSYTRAQQPVVYHSWLSAVVFWLVYNAGGISLTVLLRGLVVGLAYGLSWAHVRLAGAGTKLAALLVVLAALSASSNWMVRPQLLTYPLFALSLLLVWRWDRGDNRAAWLLPLASLLWVNLHGSFAMLFLLAGAGLVFGQGDRRKLLAPLALALLATLANPRGWQVWQYLVASLTVPSSQVFSVEWRPPVNDNWQNGIFFLWMLIFAPVAAVSRQKLSRLEWAWFLGFGALGFWGLRYVVWALFVLVPLTGKLLAGWGARWLDRPVEARTPALNGLLALAFVLLSTAFLPGVREKWWQEAPPALSSNTPVEATAWLAQHPHLPGPLWADLDFSSYLTYALESRQVWIDTRFEVYPVEQWERYIRIAEAAPDWQALLDEEGVDLLFLSPDRQPRLVLALENTSGWCQVYRDEQALITYRLAPGDGCPP